MSTLSLEFYIMDLLYLRTKRKRQTHFVCLCVKSITIVNSKQMLVFTKQYKFTAVQLPTKVASVLFITVSHCVCQTPCYA